MLQFYLLSVTFNLAAGLALSFEAVSRRLTRVSGLSGILTTRGSKTALGIASLIAGFVTLFVPVGGTLIIGDLIPSVFGIAMGIALLFDVFKQDAVFPAERTGRPDRPAGAYRTALGLLGMASGLLHFLLPEKLLF
jgi:hypothetical protein